MRILRSHRVAASISPVAPLGERIGHAGCRLVFLRNDGQGLPKARGGSHSAAEAEQAGLAPAAASARGSGTLGSGAGP